MHLVLSHLQKLGLVNTVRSLLPRSNTMCVEEVLQQSFVSYEAVWTECPATASIRRRVCARLVPSAEDSHEEREICQFQKL